MANPIWKDYYVSLGQTDSIQYRILADGAVIYAGKAFKRPGQTTISIRINDIIADYLMHIFPVRGIGVFSPMETPVIRVEYLNESDEWTTADEMSFLANWSYDYGYDPATMGMSFPINGRVDERQKIVISVYDAQTIVADVIYNDGNQSLVYVDVLHSADFNEDFNDDYTKSARSQMTGTAIIDLSLFTNVNEVRVEGMTYKVVPGCNRYALYYVNAYGGWDSLLIEGNHAEVDNLTRFTREVEYDNRDIMNRGTQNYVNAIKKTVNLHTSWLSDGESARMHNLLNSTEVYLFDIPAGEILPVVIENTSTEYKTYKGNGGKLVNYEINVSVAHDRIRR